MNKKFHFIPADQLYRFKGKTISRKIIFLYRAKLSTNPEKKYMFIMDLDKNLYLEFVCSEDKLLDLKTGPKESKYNSVINYYEIFLASCKTGVYELVGLITDDKNFCLEK